MSGYRGELDRPAIKENGYKSVPHSLLLQIRQHGVPGVDGTSGEDAASDGMTHTEIEHLAGVEGVQALDVMVLLTTAWGSGAPV
jgi:hypothetical protein